MNEQKALEAEAKAGPHVEVVVVKKSDPNRTLTLVGEARPFATVTLYAKVSGYMKSIKVDKGDHVKKDQVLAIIESPEIDKNYQGALADSENKSSISRRMNQLRNRSLVSPQEADQADSDAKVAKSRLESLAVQKAYETLRAPFDGTVTSRYADAGALVQNAENSQTSAQPVVTISQVDSLRVYVYVDQKDAAFIQVGGPAQVSVAERPDLHLTAMITRVSGELDPKTKMLLTEIDIDNKQGQLVPGSFVQVTLNLKIPEQLEVPAQSLLIQQGKSFVVTVDDADLIHYKEVKAGDNDGQFVSIYSGVNENERVAVNLGSQWAEGSHIRPIVKDKPPEAKPADAKPTADQKPAEPKPEQKAEPKAEPKSDDVKSVTPATTPPPEKPAEQKTPPQSSNEEARSK
jgi:RND family efflux transporter MFP subunit